MLSVRQLRLRPIYRFLTISRNSYCKNTVSAAAEKDADINSDKKQEVAGLEYFKQLSSTLHGSLNSKERINLLENTSSNLKDTTRLNSLSVTQQILAQKTLDEKVDVVESNNITSDKTKILPTESDNSDVTVELGDKVQAVQDVPVNLVPQRTVSAVDGTQKKKFDVGDAEEGTRDLRETKAETAVKIQKKYDVPGSKLAPTYNLAAFVNKSETLQQFLKLGVELSRWDKLEGISEFILKSDFERDLKPHISFLVDKGVPADALSYFFTKNPFIFQEDLNNLQSRIDYFTSKNFSSEAIGRIITKAPFVLNLKTATVDGKLGYFQREFKLTGNDVRKLITRQPKLVTYDFNKIKHTQFSMSEEFGFSPSELKTMILSKPKLWLASRDALQRRFQLIHNTIGLTHEQISQFPEALLNRQFRTKQRHLYLEKINRAQYDATKENYVSLKALVSGNDEEFCRKIAKTSVIEFNEFLKTL